MKISLGLGARQLLSRETAWGCLTANLAVPGLGSLMAGRVSGYPQAVLGLGGLALSLSFGVRFVYWSLANWSRLHDPEADPFVVLGETWLAARWALLGMALFAGSWLWALLTSRQILRSATEPAAPAPPSQP